MIISNLSDVAGTGEDRRKGETPKRKHSLRTLVSGHTVNSHMTVIHWDGALLRAEGDLTSNFKG